MTPEQRRAFDEGPRPPRFTGLWRGRYYHKGRRWLGPTNAVGRRGPQLGRPYIMAQHAPHAWGLQTRYGGDDRSYVEGVRAEAP